jgi:8-oxo-dGTP pyrophosphatase MutT (NUDIX family)
MARLDRLTAVKGLAQLGGTLDPEEAPLDCAKRELIEETGYRADHWRVLGIIYSPQVSVTSGTTCL